MTAVLNTFNKKFAAVLATMLMVLAAMSINPTAAFAVANDVSGTVTATTGGGNLSGVTVEASSAALSLTVTASTVTNGTYTLPALAASNDWIIKFSKTGYVTEWYNNKSSAGAADAVDNTGGAVTGVSASLATALGTVQGRVRSIGSSNTPVNLEGATVEAYKSGTLQGSTGTTDADGNYTISNLAAGTYTLKFIADGTISAYLGGSSTIGSATTFTLAAGQTVTGKNIDLVQKGHISGHVGTQTGVTVTAHKSDGSIAATDTTAAGGGYDILNLEPGNYYLEFSASGYQTKWYNEKASFTSAKAATGSRITVASGSETVASTVTALQATADLTSTVAAPSPAVPTISGSAVEGSTLTANPGTWANGVEVNYQWQTNASGSYAAIPGAINQTYVVTANDVAWNLRVVLTGSKASWIATSATSAATVIVTHAFSTSPLPTITGTATVGQTLTANTGDWTPTPDAFAYQWYRNTTAISGATSSTYVLTTSEVGYTITVKVTADKTDYPLTARTSTSTAIVGNLITVSPYPTISGTFAVGKTITAVPGAWTPSTVSFAYQWNRNGTAITGATSSSYTLVAADYSNYISLTVTASATNYTPVSRTTVNSYLVLNQLTSAPVPTITGNSSVGSVLTVDPGTWGPAPVTLSYQWYRNNVAISGAYGTTYTLVAADDLTNITVGVTGSKSGYGDEIRVSSALNIGAQFTNHNAPTISGNAWVGQTLTATIGLWDTGATLTHQWFRNGVAISGATGHSYKLVAADLGTVITVATTGTKTGFITKTATSAATKTIAAGRPFVKGATPTITGTLKVGKILTANRGVWNPIPTKVTYQWFRNNVAITGATAKTYKLVAADKGGVISVKVTGTKSGYAPLTKTSRVTLVIK